MTSHRRNPTYYLKAAMESMMTRSIQMATERFSMARMLPEYYNLMYQPMVSKKRFREMTVRAATQREAFPRRTDWKMQDYISAQ